MKLTIIVYVDDNRNNVLVDQQKSIIITPDESIYPAHVAAHACLKGMLNTGLENYLDHLDRLAVAEKETANNGYHS